MSESRNHPVGTIDEGLRFFGIAHSSVVVSDMERSLVFYRDVLQLAVTDDHEIFGDFLTSVTGIEGARIRVVLLSAGDRVARVELLEYLQPRSTGVAPEPPETGASHVALYVADIHAAYRRLIDADVIAVAEPQSDGAHWALNVYDPDGIRVELLQRL